MKPGTKTKCLKKAKLLLKKKADAKAAEAACEEAVCDEARLPPPAEELEGLKVGDKVRMWSDKHGRQWAGAECVVKSFAGGSAVQVETEALRHHRVQRAELELRSNLKPANVVKNLRQVTA